jgi:hypothetical protein
VKPFRSVRVAKHFTQINTATPDRVFPLLCPVREKDWIDGWEYTMIYSRSGLAEQGCVFTTPGEDNKITTWYITEHKASEGIVEFVRVTPGEMLVKISIRLTANKNGTTSSAIMYEYSSLSEEANRFIENQLDGVFTGNMLYWEKAINHYLQTGEKLLKN